MSTSVNYKETERAYKKHYPPAPDDEIWRLEKIAKDGKLHRRLNEAGIRKVEDFLMQLFTDSKKLREILGKSITQKNWDILIDHARTCNMEQQTLFATHRLSALEKERGDTIVKKALDNQNDVREFNGETFSGLMQKKNSSPFPSQVFGGRIENFTLVPPTLAAPAGPEAPLRNAGFLAQGHNGAAASALPVQLQNTNSGNAMKLLVSDNVCVAMQQPPSTGPWNVLISQGDDGTPTARPSMQFHGNNFQNAMWSDTIHSSSQTDYTGGGSVLDSELPCASTSSFHSWSATPHPEGNPMMGDSPTIGLDDILEFDDLLDPPIR